MASVLLSQAVIGVQEQPLVRIEGRGRRDGGKKVGCDWIPVCVKLSARPEQEASGSGIFPSAHGVSMKGSLLDNPGTAHLTSD